MKALNRGYWITSFLSAIAFYFATKIQLGNMWFFAAGMVGLLTSIAFVYFTLYVIQLGLTQFE